MVFLTASKRITSLIGSPLLRFGLAARSSNLFLPFGGGMNNANSFPPSNQQQPPSSSDTPYLDMALLIPFSQKLLSLALYDESQKAVSQHFRQQQEEESKENKNGMLDSLLSSSSQASQSSSGHHQDSSPTIMEISNLRIQAYDDVIRKTLLPKEDLSNLQNWRGHLRILKWARAEFLISKYGPMVKVRNYTLV